MPLLEVVVDGVFSRIALLVSEYCRYDVCGRLPWAGSSFSG
jgi:hypothetical protein